MLIDGSPAYHRVLGPALPLVTLQPFSMEGLGMGGALRMKVVHRRRKLPTDILLTNTLLSINHT